MPAFDCKICFISFDNEVHLPRILLCGHTFCTLCLKTILESSKSCPSCRKLTSSEIVEEYTVNYMILEMLSGEEGSEPDSLESKEQFSHQLQKIKSEFEDMKPTLKSLKNKLEEADRGEEQLKTLIEKSNDNDFFDDDFFDDEGSNEKIEELNDIVEDIRNTFRFNLSEVPITNVSLKCQDFKSVTDLVNEIRKGVINNKKFAALLRVDGVMNFAKISFRDDTYLCIHSFEKLEKKHDFETICFQNLLKTLLSKYSICAFFDFFFRNESFPKLVMVQISKFTSIIGSQFLKLCTGELGTSYKGLQYENHKYTTYRNSYSRDTHTKIILKGFNWQWDDLDTYSKHFCLDDNISLTSRKAWYLTCEKSCSFEIVEIDEKVDSHNILGSIVDLKGDFHNIFNESDEIRKILDCGIAFRVGF